MKSIAAMMALGAWTAQPFWDDSPELGDDQKKATAEVVVVHSQDGENHVSLVVPVADGSRLVDIVGSGHKDGVVLLDVVSDESSAGGRWAYAVVEDSDQDQPIEQNVVFGISDENGSGAVRRVRDEAKPRARRYRVLRRKGDDGETIRYIQRDGVEQIVGVVSEGNVTYKRIVDESVKAPVVRRGLYRARITEQVAAPKDSKPSRGVYWEVSPKKESVSRERAAVQEFRVRAVERAPAQETAELEIEFDDLGNSASQGSFMFEDATGDESVADFFVDGTADAAGNHSFGSYYVEDRAGGHAVVDVENVFSGEGGVWVADVEDIGGNVIIGSDSVRYRVAGEARQSQDGNVRIGRRLPAPHAHGESRPLVEGRRIVEFKVDDAKGDDGLQGAIVELRNEIRALRKEVEALRRQLGR